MSDLNKAMLIGRLGRDPETRKLDNGEDVANFSIATSEKWKDRETGEAKEKTEWHKISVFGGLARVCAQYLRKGSQVYIEGAIRTRKWQDKQGNDRYSTEIICREMQMLGSKPSGEAAPAKPASNAATPSASGPPLQGRTGSDYDESDIPF